jgi:chromosomal replication initiator protein
MNLPPGFWDGVLRRLEAVVPAWFLTAWLQPIAVEPRADGLRLLCQTPFQRDRVRERCLADVERCVAEEAGRPLPVVLDLGATALEAKTPAPVAAPPPPAARVRADAPAATSARPAPASRQYELPYRFDTFVVGSCNALAREAALAVAHGRQRRANPLFIAGGVGLGKTHLARATLAEARANGTERALYAPADGFSAAFTRALLSGQADRFQRRFRNGCDLLVLEDVQTLKTKRATQNELFRTIEHLVDAGGRVLVTGDRMPRDLGLDPRLGSQLAAGLVAEVEPPDAAVRRRILRTKAAAGGVRLPDDCLDLLVEKVHGSVRDLEGVLIQLVESAALLERRIDLDLTLSAIQKVAPLEDLPQRLDLDDVIRTVASFTGTSQQAMCARSRRRDVLQPRQLAMYLCRRFTDASLTEIAQAFQRKHPAVRNAIEVVERGILKRPQLRYQVEAVAARLEELRKRGEDA